MPIVRTENLKPGMIVQEDIFSDYGGILINAGEPIDERILEKLRLHNIKSVRTIDELNCDFSIVSRIKTDISPQAVKTFTQEYHQKSEDVKNVFKQVTGDATNVNIEQNLRSITDDLLRAIDQPEDIFKYFSRMKKTAPSIFTHSINVSVLCNLFATLLDYPEEKKQELTLAGLLHDIGKAELELDIQYNSLNQDNLSPKILEKYQKHTILGYRILTEKGLSKNICMGTLMHHENVQGTGFPTSAKWDQIHEFAKIIAIADYYDHLTFSGSMKKDVNPFSVIKILENVQFNKFDINFVTTFLRRMATFYQNEWVELTTGEIGQIVFINQNDLAHPIVRIGNAVVDLSQEGDVDIRKIL